VSRVPTALPRVSRILEKKPASPAASKRAIRCNINADQHRLLNRIDRQRFQVNFQPLRNVGSNPEAPLSRNCCELNRAQSHEIGNNCDQHQDNQDPAATAGSPGARVTARAALHAAALHQYAVAARQTSLAHLNYLDAPTGSPPFQRSPLGRESYRVWPARSPRAPPTQDRPRRRP
jgi:hypothetical protein